MKQYAKTLKTAAVNAWKWAKGRISVTALEDGALLRIRIDDDGPGLSLEGRKEAMRRGKRLDETTPGSGLGLSIVRQLARLMGGEAGVESRVGEGSTFWFTLPEHDLGLSESAEVQGQLTVS